MEIEGMIIRDLGETGGVSKAGNQWKKHEWVLETTSNFPRKVKFHVFGDRADTIKFELGKSYVLSVDIESREFNERWYTDVSVYAARQVEAGQNMVNSQTVNQQNTTFPPTGNPAPVYNQPAVATDTVQENPFQKSEVDFTAGDSSEDLPF